MGAAGGTSSSQHGGQGGRPSIMHGSLMLFCDTKHTHFRLCTYLTFFLSLQSKRSESSTLKFREHKLSGSRSFCIIMCFPQNYKC